jgi:hypothetical protein
MFNWNPFKPKAKAMPEQVKQAEKLLPDVIKKMSIPNLAKKINELNRPNKWQLTRRASQGMQKSSHGGNNYPSVTSEARRQRRLRQIEKGIIQVTEEK